MTGIFPIEEKAIDTVNTLGWVADCAALAIGVSSVTKHTHGLGGKVVVLGADRTISNNLSLLKSSGDLICIVGSIIVVCAVVCVIACVVVSFDCDLSSLIVACEINNASVAVVKVVLSKALGTD